MIICTKCNLLKPTEDYFPHKKVHRKIKCKQCYLKHQRERSAKKNKKQKEKALKDPKHKEKLLAYYKSYRENNLEKIKEKDKIRKGTSENLAKRRERDRERMKNDPEYKRKKDESRKKSIAKDPIGSKRKQKEYYLKNKFEKNKKDTKSLIERMKKDPCLKCRRGISRAIDTGLKRTGNSKLGNSCWNHLPYTPEELMMHLESQFANPANLTPDGKVYIYFNVKI